ncbi:SDR family oxidoreductase [[Clostridium] polysaccharolyticum]|uniref:Short-chain dehydrogenase n=1 Tax=[Clostridium] polysaccharolyticum TaxID=29364 RepID=A0A1I0BG73_9FIRM|nr:SDR family oxidoreductase [[Clostridium] polysaccharolyticum]SET05903.1 Short-chain dehydrogenase [[Clostridium] polysaccharolyticum]
MKTVVITGSTKGLGYALAKQFLKNKCQVVIHGKDPEKVKECCRQLKKEHPHSFVCGYACDVRNTKSLEELWNYAIAMFCMVDIWINNTGINLPDKYLWELRPREIDQITEIDLRSTIYGSQIAVNGMREQGSGAIYNVEGLGSSRIFGTNLSLCGTTTQAITCFSNSLTKEMRQEKTHIIIGKLDPGVILSDFLNNNLGIKSRTEPSQKTKEAYNIYGDYPEKIARYLVFEMLTNTKNGVRINWLTNARAIRKLILSKFRKRDLFA